MVVDQRAAKEQRPCQRFIERSARTIHTHIFFR
jgi:hypothetical protein